MLVSKEDLESIKEGHKRYFQNKEKEILVIGEGTSKKTKETLPSIYRDRFRPKNQWIVMQRTLYKPTRITYKALKG